MLSRRPSLCSRAATRCTNQGVVGLVRGRDIFQVKLPADEVIALGKSGQVSHGPLLSLDAAQQRLGRAPGQSPG